MDTNTLETLTNDILQGKSLGDKITEIANTKSIPVINLLQDYERYLSKRLQVGPSSQENQMDIMKIYKAISAEISKIMNPPYEIDVELAKIAQGKSWIKAADYLIFGKKYDPEKVLIALIKILDKSPSYIVNKYNEQVKKSVNNPTKDTTHLKGKQEYVPVKWKNLSKIISRKDPNILTNRGRNKPTSKKTKHTMKKQRTTLQERISLMDSFIETENVTPLEASKVLAEKTGVSAPYLLQLYKKELDNRKKTSPNTATGEVLIEDKTERSKDELKLHADKISDITASIKNMIPILKEMEKDLNSSIEEKERHLQNYLKAILLLKNTMDLIK